MTNPTNPNQKIAALDAMLSDLRVDNRQLHEENAALRKHVATLMHKIDTAQHSGATGLEEGVAMDQKVKIKTLTLFLASVKEWRHKMEELQQMADLCDDEDEERAAECRGEAQVYDDALRLIESAIESSHQKAFEEVVLGKGPAQFEDGDIPY
jgi:undecaprenyl pyrophosphate synthase